MTKDGVCQSPPEWVTPQHRGNAAGGNAWRAE